jgi:hypothetical protein
MDRWAPQSLQDLAALAENLRERIQNRIGQIAHDPLWTDWRIRIEFQLARNVDQDWLADGLAQTMLWGELASRLAVDSVVDGGWPQGAAEEVGRPAQNFLSLLRRRLCALVPVFQIAPLVDLTERVRNADFKAVIDDLRGTVSGDPVVFGYEQFLAEFDRTRRSQAGVYYTPRSVASFLVRSVDSVLTREFGLALGLADTTAWQTLDLRQAVPQTTTQNPVDQPFIQILDPACGTGVFLVEVIDRIHRCLMKAWESEGLTTAEAVNRWVFYVRRWLLPRLIGFELMMAPWAIAHVALAAALARTGYRLGENDQFRVYLTDTIADPAGTERDLFMAGSRSDVDIRQFASAKIREPITVVIGNPPFSGVSANRSRWIENLLRGRGSRAARGRSYYEIAGRALGERKVWLSDDYVKFFRYAQWRIDAAGCGVVGLVTNHGYLDNPTFRGMRYSLMETFSDIAVLDLHGNVKKRGRGGGATPDESVFPTEQAVAISILTRSPTGQAPCRIRRGDLHGTRDGKCSALDESTAEQLVTNRITPGPPFYFFAAHDDEHRDEYERGFRLPEVMPVNTTAPVTARDGLVVAFDDAELLERIAFLRERCVSDEEVRQRCFPKPRSHKYPAGDTRGWKLPAARHRLQTDAKWRERIAHCLYRPFDHRAIYWVDWMIDWPRTDVMRHFAGGSNVGLVARRQMLPDAQCNFFWVTDGITVDGVIRSDNRGSESVFPLFLCEPAGTPKCRVNFAPEFVQVVKRTLPGYPALAIQDLETRKGPVRWLGYLYAQFHSQTYRQRYATFLRIDFPRVFVTKDPVLWKELAHLGCQLFALHLGPVSRAVDLVGRASPVTLREGAGLVSSGTAAVAPGYPKYRDHSVWINRDQRFTNVSREVWEFCVGGHQVSRKWLRDRRGRVLSKAEIGQYDYAVGAIDRTRDVMAEIDRAIESRGGWPTAFAANH